MSTPPIPPTPPAQTPIMRCPHCGTANRAGSNFCNGCGTELADSQTLGALSNLRDSSPQQGAHDPQPTKPPTQPDLRAVDLTSPPPTSPNDAFADQPWLRLEFAGESESAHDADLESSESAAKQQPEDEATFEDGGRLVTAIQGLLTPIRIATNITDETPLPTKQNVTTVDELSNDELRLIRGLMSEQPMLVNYQTRPALRPPLPLRVSWIFALLALAIGLPALFFLGGPVGVPHRWSGVEDAYLAIQGVSPGSLVVVYWAYDPATAGELDLPMQPVIRHLLQRRARIAVITTTPGGIGSAERLIAQVRSQGTENLTLAADLGQPITFAYLPGGAASLPFFARDPAAAIIENIEALPQTQREALDPRPNLIVVAAAQSEDVQQWLEQVQPLEHTSVVAITAAGADPILRPYYDSQQLSGLVSGFDGAYNYRKLLEPYIAPESNSDLLRHTILQNWGHLAILALVALGNLAALLSREGSA